MYTFLDYVLKIILCINRATKVWIRDFGAQVPGDYYI
jgi:hypothetical protein